MYGIKDAETHMLNEWLGFSKISSLQSEANAALHEFKYCSQGFEFASRGEEGGIQCGNQWLSPVEDLQRRAQEQVHFFYKRTREYDIFKCHRVRCFVVVMMKHHLYHNAF